MAPTMPPMPFIAFVCSGAKRVQQPPRKTVYFRRAVSLLFSAILAVSAGNGAHGTMYSLHVVTCSFTWVRCVPTRDIKGGKTWVQTS